MCLGRPKRPEPPDPPSPPTPPPAPEPIQQAPAAEPKLPDPGPQNVKAKKDKAVVKAAVSQKKAKSRLAKGTSQLISEAAEGTGLASADASGTGVGLNIGAATNAAASSLAIGNRKQQY